jgi:hypothetical protein
MNREVLQALKDGAMDALRLYAALISAPFVIMKAFANRPPGEPFRYGSETHRLR